jgi:hypothetical protein
MSNPTTSREIFLLDSKQNIHKENQVNGNRMFHYNNIKRANSAPSLGRDQPHSSTTGLKTPIVDGNTLKKLATTPTYTLNDLPNNFLNMSFTEIIELCEHELVKSYNKETSSGNTTLFGWSNTMNITNYTYLGLEPNLSTNVN